MPAWFKLKSSGYGKTPATWQGWAITFVFGLSVVSASYAMEMGWISTLWGFAAIGGATLGFITLSNLLSADETAPPVTINSLPPERGKNKRARR